jgi:hypothetical protein
MVMGGCARYWVPSWHNPERIMKKIDSEVRELKLTAEQQVRYEGIRARLEKDIRAHMSSMQALHQQIEKDLAGSSPDVNAMTSRLKQRLADDGDPRVKLVDYFGEFYNILDKDQQKKLLDHMQRHHRCPFSRS